MPDDTNPNASPSPHRQSPNIDRHATHPVAKHCDFRFTVNAKIYSCNGYSPGVHDGCSIVGVFGNGQLAHTCDTNPGASGSAIFALFNDGEFYIVGLHSSSRPLPDGRRINAGVQVSHWSRQAREML